MSLFMLLINFYEYFLCRNMIDAFWLMFWKICDLGSKDECCLIAYIFNTLLFLLLIHS